MSISVTKQEILEEGKRVGMFEWANVCYEQMARDIKTRLLKEQPNCDASIGLLPNDTWIIWYNPSKCTWNHTKRVHYFHTFSDAREYALQYGFPTNRIIAYQKGWAIQMYKSGPYAIKKEA